MDYCIYEDIDKLDRYSYSSSENSTKSYDIPQKVEKIQIKPIQIDIYSVIDIPELATNTIKKCCKSPSFYFKNLNRNQSEALLFGHDNGVFLIRNSVNYKGNLTLSFVMNGQFEHYLIERNSEKFVSINDVLWFSSIEKLVKHYQLNQENLSTLLSVGLSSNDLYINPSLNVNVMSVKDVKFNEFIGSGEFADVRKGETNNRPVAIKQFKSTETSIKSCIHEAEIMSCLNHENILKIYGISVLSRILIYTEFMSYGCLLEYLRSRGRNLIDVSELIKYAHQTASGLEYLESKKIIHRDICAANVLLNRFKTAKIGDFGSAISANRDTYFPTTKLRIKWTAPESLGGKNFTSKSDVWSYGVLIWEIFSYGRTPYPRVPMSYMETFLVGGDRMKVPEICYPEVSQIIYSCWKLKPIERPSFKNLKKIISYLIK